MVWKNEVVEVTYTSLQLTSLKGVPRVFKVKSDFLKVMWIIFVLGFFGISLYFVQHQYSEYMEFPTVINFKELPPTDDLIDSVQLFPSILMCNLKPVHIHDNDSVTNLMDYLDDVTDNITDFLGKRVDSEFFDEIDASLQQAYKVQSYFEFIGKEIAPMYGQKREQFIVSCTITSDVGRRIYPCDEVADIKPLLSPNYFNCFSITMETKSVKELRPLKLSVILHLNDVDDYLHTDFSDVSNDLQSSGAYVLLHSGLIDMEKRGIRLAPGTLNSIHFETEQRRRLKPPHEVCISDWNDTLLHRFYGHPLTYNEIRCRSACKQAVVSKQCQCLRSEMYAVHTIEETRLPFCGAPRETFEERVSTLRCSMVAMRESSFACDIHCAPPCEETLINTDTTYSIWPRHSQKLGFYKSKVTNRSFTHQYTEYEQFLYALDADTNKDKVREVLDTLKGLDKIEKNFLKLEAIMTAPTLSIIETKEKITVWDLLSSIASFVNLFSGITLIVFVELLDYIVHMILVFTRGRQEEKKIKQQKTEDKFDFTVHL